MIDGVGREDRAGALGAFFGGPGFRVEANGASCATLLDAMDHPERYVDLTVRVSGYLLSFVRLSRKQQLDVINSAFQE